MATRAYISPGIAVVIEQGEGNNNANQPFSPVVSPMPTGASATTTLPSSASAALSRSATSSLDVRSIKRVGGFGSGGSRSSPLLPAGGVGDGGEDIPRLSEDRSADRSATAEDNSGRVSSHSYSSSSSSSRRNSRGRRQLSRSLVLQRFRRGSTGSNISDLGTDESTGEAFSLSQEGRIGVKESSSRDHVRGRTDSSLDLLLSSLETAESVGKGKKNCRHSADRSRFEIVVVFRSFSFLGVPV